MRISLGFILILFNSFYPHLGQATERPQTRLIFLDKCTGQNTRVVDMEKAPFIVRFEKLKPHSTIELNVSLSPLGGNADADEKHANGNPDKSYKRVVTKVGIKIGKEGTYDYKQTISFDPNLLKKRPELWAYSVKATWMEKEGQATGEAETKILVPIQKNEPIYRSLGSSICLWQSEVQLASSYKFNHGEGKMLLNKGSNLDRTDGLVLGLGGEDIQLQNNFFSAVNIPLIVWFNNYQTYIKREWENSNYHQFWSLGPNQGGFFGSRISFSRFPVEKIVKGWNGTCRTWQNSQKGFLDVGKVNYDFYVVPEHLSSAVDDTRNFIEEMNPALNTCDQTYENGSADKVIPESHGFMFFYPL